MRKLQLNIAKGSLKRVKDRASNHQTTWLFNAIFRVLWRWLRGFCGFSLWLLNLLDLRLDLQLLNLLDLLPLSAAIIVVLTLYTQHHLSSPKHSAMTHSWDDKMSRLCPTRTWTLPQFNLPCSPTPFNRVIYEWWIQFACEAPKLKKSNGEVVELDLDKAWQVSTLLGTNLHQLMKSSSQNRFRIDFVWTSIVHKDTWVMLAMGELHIVFLL